MRLMTGREALEELNDLIEGKPNTLVTYEARKYTKKAEPSKKLLKRARLNRMRFLVDYIHGKLPIDADHEGCC